MLTGVQTRSIQGRVWLLLAAAFVLTVLAYWPSLRGGYVFDDYPNIVANPSVHLDSLSWKSLREAALSSPSPVLIRPLAMLSFGVNWYFSDGNPRDMKAVNLAIHLVNGLLVFLLLRRITRIAQGDARNGWYAELLPLCVSAAWLLAPINFTAVGYIVQRMESLCQIFVLLGLLGYVAARQRMLSGRTGFPFAILALVLGTGLGFLAKESAILLPIYALVLEWIVFRFAGFRRRVDRRLYWLYFVLVFIPVCAAAIWASLYYLPASAWTGRPFTLAERLLTEPRILADYVRWSLVPTANTLALYHDQIPLSRGLLSPPTTLAGLAFVIVAAGSVPLLRMTRPLAALGVAWFLCAHLLTGTVVPLELVFEHRNYFASIGLYILVFSIVMPRTGSSMVFARATACVAMLTLFMTVTWVRALDWSNPVAFAMSEMEKNPDSPRTAYELARTYVILSRYDAKSPLVPEAYASLEHAASMPGADALADQGLLILSGRLKQRPPAGTWERMQQKLSTQALSAQNISALYSLSRCAVDGDCGFPPAEMIKTFAAALARPAPNPKVLSVYANYAINVLHDAQLAIELAKTGVQVAPGDLQMRRNLLLLLQTTGRHDEAEAFYEQTLRDVTEARDDQTFRKWSEDLLQNRQPPTRSDP